MHHLEDLKQFKKKKLFNGYYDKIVYNHEFHHNLSKKMRTLKEHFVLQTSGSYPHASKS